MNNQADLETIKTALSELLYSISSKLNESLKNKEIHLIREERLERIDSNTIKILDDVRIDFFSWIYGHESDIVNLPTYKNCIEKMSQHENFKYYENEMKNVLFGFIIDYFEETLESTTQNIELFDNLYEKYMNWFSSHIYECMAFCPLFNFDSQEEKIAIDDRLTIRRINSDEVDQLLKYLSPHEIGPQIASCFVIEQIEKRDKFFYMINDYSLIDSIIFALRLTKSGNIWGGIKFDKFISPPWEKAKHSTRKYYVTIPHGNGFVLKKDDIQNLKRIYLIGKNLDTKFLERYKDLSRAIKWFNKFYDEQDIENRFACLMFAIEALCSDSVETTYKLSNRVALTIGENDVDMLNIRNKLKEIYDKPRKIFHGGEVNIKTEDISSLEDFTRRLLKSFISLYINDYNGKIDYSSIVENKRGKNKNTARSKIMNLIDNSLLSIKERNKLNKIKNLLDGETK